MSKLWASGALAALLIAGSGCATLFRPVPVEQVSIVSSPPGARVFVDQKELGVTPLEVELSLRTQEHALTLDREGCLAKEVRLGRVLSKRRFVPMAAYPLLALLATNDAGGPSGVGDWVVGFGVYTLTASLFDKWTGARYALPRKVEVSLCGAVGVDSEFRLR